MSLSICGVEDSIVDYDSYLRLRTCGLCAILGAHEVSSRTLKRNDNLKNKINISLFPLYILFQHNRMESSREELTFVKIKCIRHIVYCISQNAVRKIEIMQGISTRGYLT